MLSVSDIFLLYSHIYVLFTTLCFCSETFTGSISCQQYLHKIVKNSFCCFRLAVK